MKADRTLTPHWHTGCSLERAPDRHGHVLLFRPGGMIRLDDDAARVGELIDGRHTVEQIIEILHTRFPNLPETGTDVDDFIRTASQKHWIDLH